MSSNGADAVSVVAQSFGGRVVSPEKFPELKTLLDRIQEAYDPIDIVLYGSQARGEATEQSDWDLKIIVSDDASDNLFSPLFGWRVQEGSGVYADLSCVRLSDFRADLDIANSATSHMTSDGIVLDVA
ncbi:nucleotidyltransferase domain-containing protein [Agrobacterium rubi]|uniref:nucleotidyltransferase domain-containing protein n=1 Tax=Agrobacterium rubi TaxID=28099 RepID=UPI0015722753|nr:nucleotidyltransferase domain-containing protein [Agrobacterium rubi]NTF08481.1 nucleotidyltransferase domain-containing protein [Agrobacterium rubi]NTF20709.1 nucleotidyltransferase domain-containing protein [Agrobacterium rubi]NTF27679.1 nucleotidyltransferase domain-containing protein [Agrobacterium rubi]